MKASAAAAGAAQHRDEIASWLRGFLSDPQFLAAYPYYAAILATLTPVADPSISRMAVSLHEGRFFLHLNVDSFMAEPQYLRGVLLHEVHHIVLGHLTHPKFAECEEPELMDLAVEMSANEYIVEPLPPAVTCKAYAAIGVRPGQSTLERYEILLRSMRGTGKKPRPAQVPGEGDGASGTADDHRFLARGRTMPGATTQAAMLVARAVAEPPPVPSAEEENPRQHLLAGRSPSSLVEELFGTTLAPKNPLDWRAALEMFVSRTRSPAHSWSRPNRRFPGRIFEVPGRSWASRRAEKAKILVAIDTSLSMTRRELEEIARQLVIVGEHAEVIIAECDVAVSRISPFAGRLDYVIGRGGTDLRPVFAPSVIGAHDVDGVVYFTDGDGPFSPTPPPVPTLWVLTKPTHFDCPWGERARLRPTHD